MDARFLVLIFLSLSVISCGGGSGSDSGGENPAADTSGSPGADAVRYLGVVNVDEDTEVNEVEADAFFFRYGSAVNAAYFEVLASPVLDVCSVETIDLNFTPDDFHLPELASVVDAEEISAGSVLTLMSGAGSYFDLVRQEAFGVMVYSADPEFVSGSMPAQLTLSIPGDGFPQFSNVDMPVVSSLVVSAPSISSTITPSTDFSWVAGNNSGGYLSLSSASVNGDGTLTTVDCDVRDDGSFSFPAQTQSNMGSTFMGFGADITREVVRIERQGDAVLMLVASSGR